MYRRRKIRSSAGISIELERLEAERCRALLESDIEALERLNADELVYTHSSSRRDDKTSYLGKIRTGFYRYLSFSSGPRSTTVIGSVALVHSRIAVSVMVDGVRRNLDNEVLAVWTLEADQWRLIAYQPTPVPEASRSMPAR